MSDVSYLTKDGYDRIRRELHDLKTRGREEASRAIAEAREKGDLSENAEYDAAKDAQGLLELKINNLEKVLANAKILDSKSVNTDQVSILTKVRIKNLKINKELEYTLVSETEANVKEKKISVSSPIGAGLMGKKRGEIATVQTPAGEMKFEIIDISV